MRLPTDSQRIVIAGHTGSGKTMEALHHLSQRSIDERVWIVLDQKGDDLTSRLPVSGPLALGDDLPELPGLYVVRAPIEDHDRGGPVADLFLRIYQRGRTGVLIDEGGMVGARNKGLRTLLTLGRSRECPVILLTQRPVNIDTYALSESEFLQFFQLRFPEDRERIAKFVPPERIDFDRLREFGEHHSYYYDVLADQVTVLQPCPPFQAIYDRILTRLPRIASADFMPPGRIRV